MDKKLLIDELVKQLNFEMEAAIKSATTTADAATHEETKSEGSKDTRATEASYLARGQTKRVEELKDIIGRIKVMKLNSFSEDSPISSSAVVSLEDENETTKWYFLTTHAGGYNLKVCDKLYTTITTKSPLGKTLIQKYIDDEITLKTPRNNQFLTITDLF